MGIMVLGIDLGKNSCSLAGLDGSGRVVLRRRLRRGSVVAFVRRLDACMAEVAGPRDLFRDILRRIDRLRRLVPAMA